VDGVSELSYFYRRLYAKEITVEMMQKLEKILVLLCKMEKKFPPEVFNRMQHLPYEAKVGGPVQYRWMYPLKEPLDILNQ
jgi:hypothetical protein